MVDGRVKMTRWFAARLMVVGAVALAASASAQAAGTAAPGYAAETYAAGFQESTTNHWGPIGITFDQADRLYVGDAVDGNIYRFSPGGGSASQATQLTPGRISHLLKGLAISRSGRLYAARGLEGDVVEVDTTTGRILRTVAKLPCATGLAFDPVSGDLFVSQDQCGSTIFRISRVDSPSSAAAPYAFYPGVDGLAFDQDGTLYAESDGTVLKIAGTASPTPGLVNTLAFVSQGDGLAFGAHATGGPPYLVANRNDGIVTRVDFSGVGSSQTDIFTGGSRGDFAAVDSNGCLYITQSASIVRIRSADGTCGFEPTTPGAGTTHPNPPHPSPPHPAVCGRLRTLKLLLHAPRGTRLQLARIYVNGKPVKTVRGRGLRRSVRLGNLPHRSFTLKVVKTVGRGHTRHTLVRRRAYTNCYRGSPARTANL
jgi:hypothetical protein